jgi:NAD(P)-dependent dehydrogenase (short-subunit alcohol dehydrogenase family)
MRAVSWVGNILMGAGLVAAAIGGSLISPRKRGFSFRDKSVLITGGSRGLGLELGRILAREGASIALVARNVPSLDAAERELTELGALVLKIPCDIRNQEEVQGAIREAVRNFGKIDVLINNAGVIEVGPFDQMTLEDYQNAMATHAWGSLYAILAVIPYMRNAGGGSIVNISSIGGRIAVPHLAPYVMSKFALAGLSEALSVELAHDGILVTSVYPGLMRTGSHVNASFKGKSKQEFAWFSIAASMPVVSINAQRAARQIVEACRLGKARLIITPTARMATMADALAPSLVSRGMRVMNLLLPGSSEFDSTSRAGWESQSRWSPSMLTRLADRVIERNNEQRFTA